jgi:hypothetical protein
MDTMTRFTPRQVADADEIATPAAWAIWDNERDCPLTWGDLVRIGHRVPDWAVDESPALLEGRNIAWAAAGAYAETLGRRQ